MLSSIHDLSPASTGDTAVVETEKWACLWRSIVMSSVGKTVYPYCLWIKALNLGNLYSLLEDLARDRVRVGRIVLNYKQIRDWFFSYPLGAFLHANKSKKPVLDIEKIVLDVGNKVTSFIKQAAEDEDKTVMLSSLEGYHLPSPYLSSLVSRLSLLSSLRVRDGSVLTAEVSQAIRNNCPFFKEVVCHYCVGTDVDEELAGFIRGLPPNSLESFTIMSTNAVHSQTFQALSGHSVSLRSLVISLDQPGLAALHLLSECKNLESVTIEASRLAQILDWERELKQEFQEVVSWLSGCLSLTNLELLLVPSATSILDPIFKVPQIRLTSLDVKLLDANDEFFTSLGQQTDLESLVVQTVEGLLDIGTERHQQFTNSICNCTKLRKLDLMSELLTMEDIVRIAQSLPQLEDFSFDGEIGNDSLLPIAGMHRLKTLNVNAVSHFTFEGILRFIDDLQLDPGASHDGLRIYIMRQFGEHKISNEEERILADEVARSFEGRFEITYEADPDELHESDFSD